MKTANGFTFFWGKNDPFSQWHMPAAFTYRGIYFTQAEQFMMFCKATLFRDTIIADRILQPEFRSDPARHKLLGRKVEGFDPKVWDYHSRNIVYVGSREKFLQNPKLLDALLDTAGTELVEASPYDKIWGIGLSQDDPRALNRATWQGQNLLGEALTVLREEIIAVGPDGMSREIDEWWD